MIGIRQRIWLGFGGLWAVMAFMGITEVRRLSEIQALFEKYLTSVRSASKNYENYGLSRMALT